MPDAIRTAPRDGRTLAGPRITFSIAEETSRLRQEPEWISGTRNSVTVVKTDNLSIVLTAIKKDATLCGHEVEGPIIYESADCQVSFFNQIDAAGIDARQDLSAPELGRVRKPTQPLVAPIAVSTRSSRVRGLGTPYLPYPEDFFVFRPFAPYQRFRPNESSIRFSFSRSLFVSGVAITKTASGG